MICIFFYSGHCSLFSHWNADVMDQMCEKVLLEHRQEFIRSADVDDVLLDFLLDHLISKNCIQADQKEFIKTERLSRNRCGKLLDFVSAEGPKAFDELCNALDAFGTDSKKRLACTFRQSLKMKEDMTAHRMQPHRMQLSGKNSCS
jgi:Caspase recruitment domain